MFKTTRRGYLGSVSAALGGAALAACGAGATGGPANTPRQGPPVEVTFNTWYNGVMDPIVGSGLIKKFEDENNIKVQLDLNSTNRDMSKYTAWYVAGTAPTEPR